jgi:phosphate transport system substrate-binding protein
VIADIYLGTIKNWNDPRIVKDNPGVSLPNHAILPVYRSDGSGTTFVFTDFLCKVSQPWAQRVGKNTSVKWAVGFGQKGNEGVAGMVRQSPYSFGYVELIYALQNHMSFGSVKNAAGKFVKASVDGVTAAAAGAAKSMPADYRVSITNAPGATAYPISSFTWLLIPVPAKDATKGKALVGFLNWMLDHGESEVGALSYAPLPKNVQEMERKTIKMLH